MISFHVKSLLTNVLFEETIDIILNKIYDEKKTETNISRNIMKDLLYLCTRHGHFTYDGKIYIQIDGVATGLPLGSLLVNIFVISLEEALVPSIKKHAAYWKKHINDTHAYIDPSKIEFFLEKLSSYYYNIQFTQEIEENQKITLLDVLMTRAKDNTLEPTVFRKETNTDLCINWDSYAWKYNGNGDH